MAKKGLKKFKISVKQVVATGIGAALFFVLGRFISIPSGIPNTNISLQYAVLGLFAVMYGPVCGFLIGFIGHTLIDLSWGGAPWWSWVIASAVVGAIIGICDNKIHLWDGKFGKTEIIRYVVMNAIAHVVAWIGVAPILDIVIYAEDKNLVFTQGAVACVANFLTGVIIGGLLILVYVKTLGKPGSLYKNK